MTGIHDAAARVPTPWGVISATNASKTQRKKRKGPQTTPMTRGRADKPCSMSDPMNRGPVWQVTGNIPPVIWWNNMERLLLAVWTTWGAATCWTDTKFHWQWLISCLGRAVIRTSRRTVMMA